MDAFRGAPGHLDPSMCLLYGTFTRKLLKVHVYSWYDYLWEVAAQRGLTVLNFTFSVFLFLQSSIERELVHKTKATFQRLNVVNINIKTTSKLTMCQLFLYTKQFLKMLSSVQTTCDFLSFYLLFDCECESIFLLVAEWLVNQGPQLTHHHYQCLQEVDKTWNVIFLPDSGHWKGSYRVKVLTRNTVS